MPRAGQDGITARQFPGIAPRFHWRESVPVGAPLPGWPGAEQERGESAAGLDWAVTSRHGGVSDAPFGTLNLGAAVGDRPAAVAANRTAVADAFELPAERLLLARQCHGAQVAVVTGPWAEAAPEVDALVTTSTELALAVLVADCVPVLLADRLAGVVAAVHAGRQGLAAGVVPAALGAMMGLGAVAARIEAVVGPSICGRCYEVPPALAREVVAAVSAAAAKHGGHAVTVASAVTADSWGGTPALDLAAGVLEQLRVAGVAARVLPGCTKESPALFSYRRSGQTGRFAAVVRLTR